MTSATSQDTAPTPDRGNAAAPGRRRSWALLHRLALALLGGYAFAWGFVSLGMAGSVALGIDFHEAETALLLLVFPVYLSLFLWAFAAERLVRVWVVLVAGAVSMTAAAWGVQQMMLS